MTGNPLNEVQAAGIVREMGSVVETASLFTKSINVSPKRYTVNFLIDARYRNNFADFSNYSWPLEPTRMPLTGLDRVYYTTSVLTSVHNQLVFSKDTKKLTSLVVGGKENIFEREFYGLCGLPNFF